MVDPDQRVELTHLGRKEIEKWKVIYPTTPNYSSSRKLYYIQIGNVIQLRVDRDNYVFEVNTKPEGRKVLEEMK